MNIEMSKRTTYQNQNATEVHLVHSNPNDSVSEPIPVVENDINTAYDYIINHPRIRWDGLFTRNNIKPIDVSHTDLDSGRLYMIDLKLNMRYEGIEKKFKIRTVYVTDKIIHISEPGSVFDRIALSH